MVYENTLGRIEAKLFKHSDRCTCYGSFDRSEDAIVRTAFCPVAHAYDWQRLEHHLASIRLGKNSAPQLRQISIRLVAGFRRGLGSTIGCSPACVEFPLKQTASFQCQQ